MLLDYHMHLERGTFELSWIGQFVETARERGIGEIGVTEHAYRFHRFHGVVDNEWAWQREQEEMERYIEALLEAKRQGLPVKIGLEVDYMPDKEEQIARALQGYPWDFVVGSVHWIGDFGLDLDPDTWEGRDVEATWRAYFNILVQAAKSGLVDILGHPDVIKIFNLRPRREVAEELMAAAVAEIAKTGVTLEASSAGLRKPVGELYPDGFMLRLAREAGIPVSLASDAHHPRDVGAGYDRLVAHVREAGFASVSRYSGRRREQVPIG